MRRWASGVFVGGQSFCGCRGRVVVDGIVGPSGAGAVAVAAVQRAVYDCGGSVTVRFERYDELL